MKKKWFQSKLHRGRSVLMAGFYSAEQHKSEPNSFYSVDLSVIDYQIVDFDQYFVTWVTTGSSEHE